MSFRARLKAAREAAAYSQRELGEACKWEAAQPRIANYESGLREPTLADIAKMAQVLGVPPEELAFGSVGLSADETILVQAWRIADPDHRAAMRHLASMALRNTKAKRNAK